MFCLFLICECGCKQDNRVNLHPSSRKTKGRKDELADGETNFRPLGGVCTTVQQIFQSVCENKRKTLVTNLKFNSSYLVSVCQSTSFTPLFYPWRKECQTTSVSNTRMSVSVSTPVQHPASHRFNVNWPQVEKNSSNTLTTSNRKQDNKGPIEKL